MLKGLLLIFKDVARQDLEGFRQFRFRLLKQGKFILMMKGFSFQRCVSLSNFLKQSNLFLIRFR